MPGMFAWLLGAHAIAKDSHLERRGKQSHFLSGIPKITTSAGPSWLIKALHMVGLIQPLGTLILQTEEKPAPLADEALRGGHVPQPE